jgi:hypothetical protein
MFGPIRFYVSSPWVATDGPHSIFTLEKNMNTLLSILSMCALFRTCEVVESVESVGPVEPVESVEVFEPVRPVPRYRTVLGFRPSNPKWTPQDIVYLLRTYPNFYIDMGNYGTHPPGCTHLTSVGTMVNQVQSEAVAQGVDSSKLMFHYRADVLAPYKEGWHSCAPKCGWEGTMENAPFDPDWVRLIPRSEHLWALDYIWGGDYELDPWREAAIWPRHIDRDMLGALNTETEIVALYGAVSGGQFSTRNILMNVNDRNYRKWTSKRLVAQLKNQGIDPGEVALIQIGYKPGWHTYYSGPMTTDRCSVSNSHMVTGPANLCKSGNPPGGPFARTAYGPGEYEEASSELLRDLRAELVSAGYPDVVLSTVEKPLYDKPWGVIDPEVQNQSWLIGAPGGPTCDRRDLTKEPDPVGCGIE